MTDKETYETIRSLLGSTCAYMLNHVEKPRDQMAYMKGIARCYAIYSEYHSDIGLLREELAYITSKLPNQLKKRYWFNRENEHYILAHEHGLDIVESIIRRFVDGGRANNWTKMVDPLEENLDADQVRAYLGRVKQD